MASRRSVLDVDVEMGQNYLLLLYYNNPYYTSASLYYVAMNGWASCHAVSLTCQSILPHLQNCIAPPRGI